MYAIGPVLGAKDSSAQIYTFHCYLCFKMKTKSWSAIYFEDPISPQRDITFFWPANVELGTTWIKAYGQLSNCFVQIASLQVPSSMLFQFWRPSLCHPFLWALLVCLTPVVLGQSFLQLGTWILRANHKHSIRLWGKKASSYNIIMRILKLSEFGWRIQRRVVFQSKVSMS